MTGVAELLGILLAALGLVTYAVKALVGALTDRFKDMRDDRDYWKKRVENAEFEAMQAVKTVREVNTSIRNVADAIDGVEARLRTAESGLTEEIRRLREVEKQ